ncbi:hypothetical protein L0244_34855 [bacterium]|nr:hypothetical protein [bacterium]
MEIVRHPSDPNLQFAVSKNVLYRTTNGGRFWQPLNLKHVQSVVFNSSGSRLWAITYDYLTGQQLWASKNQGSNFSLIGSFPGSRIFVSPDDNILFASGCSAFGFCRSSDGGVSWKDFRNFPDGGPFEEYRYNYLVLSVGFPTNKTDQMYISGIYQGSHNYLSFPFFYFTENGGKNWKKISRKQVYFLKVNHDLYAYGCGGIEKTHNSSLEKISDQPLTSIINVPGNESILWGVNNCDYRAKSIWVSSNTGVSWEERKPFFHLDVTSLSAVNSGRTLFGTEGGGVYAYSNGTWIRSSTGFIKPVVNIIASSVQSGILYSITGPEYYNSRFLQKFEPGAGWFDLTNKLNLRDKAIGDYPETFRDTRIDPFDSNHVVVTIGNSAGLPRTVQTYDGGKTWNPLPLPNEPFIHNGVQFNPYKKGEMHFFNRGRFLIFRSSDSGLTFKKLPLNCSVCPGEYESIREIIYDPFNDEILYFLTYRKIWKSKDGGLSLSELPKPQRYFMSIVALPEPNSFLAFTMKAAYRTSDGGVHWKQIADYFNVGEIVKVISLTPEVEILTGIISNKNDQQFKRFAISKDRGKTWVFSFPSSLQQSDVLDIQPGSKTNEAIVATDSGLYRVAIN